MGVVAPRAPLLNFLEITTGTRLVKKNKKYYEYYAQEK